MWWDRNSDRHGRDFASRQAAARKQAQREVELLYELKSSVPVNHKWTFHVPLEQKLTSSTSVLRAWINNYEPILRDRVEHQTRLNNNNNNNTKLAWKQASEVLPRSFSLSLSTFQPTSTPRATSLSPPRVEFSPSTWYSCCLS